LTSSGSRGCWLLAYAVGAVAIAYAVASVYGSTAAIPLVVLAALLFAGGEKYRRELRELEASRR